jgi:MFS transporter, putative metabolite:H+ symporter
MIELLERQKKLTVNQWKLICTANLADLLDFFDFFLIGYVTAALTKQWSLTYWEGGAILLASGLGAVPGAFFWAGWATGSAAARCSFCQRSPSRSRPVSWFSHRDRTALSPAGSS